MNLVKTTVCHVKAEKSLSKLQMQLEFSIFGKRKQRVVVEAPAIA
jgi:hypothetical protein